MNSVRVPFLDKNQTKTRPKSDRFVEKSGRGTQRFEVARAWDVAFCHVLSRFVTGFGRAPRSAKRPSRPAGWKLRRNCTKTSLLLSFQGRDTRAVAATGEGSLGSAVHLRALLYTSVHLKWNFRGLETKGKPLSELCVGAQPTPRRSAARGRAALPLRCWRRCSVIIR
jgi:hypothetical protein